LRVKGRECDILIAAIDSQKIGIGQVSQLEI